MSPSAIAWVSSFQQAIRDQDAGIESNKERFLLPVDLKLALIRSPGQADIVITQGPDGAPAAVIEVPKDRDSSHPYRAKEVLAELQLRCEVGRPLNSYDVQCVRRAHRTDVRPEFTSASRFGPRQYSPSFVEWMVRRAQQDASFFDRARATAQAVQHGLAPNAGEAEAS